MVGPWYPPAARRPVTYATEAPRFTAPPLGWVLHVAVMNGSPWAVFENAVSPGRRFSHLWVAKDGQVEQYAPLNYQSWAMSAGNPLYWSVETEGFPGEPLTPQQVESLAQWHVYSGSLDRLAEAHREPGIGTHYMGGLSYGGHSCPDPFPGQGPRSHQRQAILARAQQIRTQGADMPLTAQDLAQIGALIDSKLAAISTDFETRFQVHTPDGKGLATLHAAVGSLWAMLSTLTPAAVAEAAAEGAAAAASGAPGVDVHALGAAVAAQIDVRPQVRDVLLHGAGQ